MHTLLANITTVLKGWQASKNNFHLDVINQHMTVAVLALPLARDIAVTICLLCKAQQKSYNKNIQGIETKVLEINLVSI